MENKALNRRRLLQTTLAGAGLLGLKIAQAQSCGLLTPEQTEGPFYPTQDQFDKDNDLTFVKGKLAKAKGEVIIVKGVVTNQYCQPIKGALVEIWQACASGKYAHPGDPNPAPLDPNFQYWGRSLTNNKGEYFFKTIRPGSYPASNTWSRPAHIHFKVHLRGHEELTTQMYFSDDKLNSHDRILMSLNSKERDKVIVSFKKEMGIPTGQFDITIKQI